MAEHLQGKVVVVTGGGRGIGRAIAIESARQAAQVVVCDRYRDEQGAAAADEVVAEIKELGGEAVAVAADVATETGGDATVQAGLDAFGRVDMLVNCAGNNVRAPFVELTEQQWDSVMDVHVKGHFFCSRAAARAMIARGEGGRIVMVASRGAFYSLPKHAQGTPHRYPCVVYSAAKAAILGMTQTLALELAEHRITVNALIPSADTQLFPGKGSRGAGGVPPTISLDPAYIAPFVAFLGTEAAAGITGRFVYVTGGDVCFFPQPLQLAGSYFVRKPGKWTVDQLAETIPPIAAAGA
ncbi:MAG TPA: SDR family oxidoreductase [Natronosporangium sp.]